MDFVYPKTLRFGCINCGICCGDTKEKNRHILMLKEEAKIISSRTGMKISDFASICVTNSPYFFEMNKNNNGKCVFLSSNNKCDIYSTRPLICRFYPLKLVDQINKMYKFCFTEECPGINQGKILDKKYFNDLFELAKIRFNEKSNKILVWQLNSR